MEVTRPSKGDNSVDSDGDEMEADTFQPLGNDFSGTTNTFQRNGDLWIIAPVIVPEIELVCHTRMI